MDFEGEVTYPKSANDSATHMMNLVTEASKSGAATDDTASASYSGGNENVNVAQVMAYRMKPWTFEYDERRTMLYALGVGAPLHPTDAKELQASGVASDSWKLTLGAYSSCMRVS